jgi:hypothetical protein
MDKYLFSTRRRCLCTMLAVGLLCALSSCGRPPESSKLPFGGVNSPVAQQVITGKMAVTGWALSEAGVESVSIYIDRAFVTDCETGLPRPDVANAYPTMAASGASGWAATVESARLAPGWHELTVQARSRKGATRDLASLPVLIQR